MVDEAYPETLPYTTQLELDCARARSVAAWVTGPCGLLLVLASRQHMVVGMLGVLAMLAAVGWWMAARGGRKRAQQRAAWRLLLDRDQLTVSTAEGDFSIFHDAIRGVAMDDDTLQVVLTHENDAELRLDATWGGLGAVDLHAALFR